MQLCAGQRVGSMKLIAMINSRTRPNDPYWEKSFEAEEYEKAYLALKNSLAEDDQLLSVRRE